MTSIKIIQRSKQNSDGNFAIALRIIKNRKRKLISLGWSCSRGEFVNQEFRKTVLNFRQKNQILAAKKHKALKLLDEFEIEGIDFTLSEFQNRFLDKNSNAVLNVWDFFEEKISDLKRSGKVGNARAYEETSDSFFKFSSKEIKFDEITPYLLQRYETHLRERGNQDGGIAFKMRELRALYNAAIRNAFVSKEKYPFMDYKISKLKGKSEKKALSMDEIKAIMNIDFSNHPNLLNSYNYFMFSFLTRGMNFIDMMNLCWSNIQNGKIKYQRSKTKKRFTLEILPQVQLILDYYWERRRDTDYVFPILLQEGLTAQQVQNRKHKTLKKFNKDLKELAELAGVKKNISSYVARHSYATVMLYKGTSMEIISEAMGHSHVNITKTYLKDFGDEIVDKAHRNLLEEPNLVYVA